MKKYQLTELANKLVQAEEFFDVNITSPDQIDILEKHFGKIGKGTEYKRDGAVTFSYYPSSSNALYTITDPGTPRYEFGDLLKDVGNVEGYCPRDEELHQNSKYTLTGNGVTIEIKGKLTITGPEGTWTIGK